MKLRCISILGLAALLSGCATGRLQRIATVQSRADALYAYDGVARFPISSELAEVSIYAPQPTKHEYQPLIIPAERPTKPLLPVHYQTAEPVAKPQAPPTTVRPAPAPAKQEPLESTEPPEAEEETPVQVEDAPKQVEKLEAADVRQQTLASDSSITERRPTLHKKASKNRVMVGEVFEFTLDFQNSTPVDLGSVELTDPLDPRLKVFPKDIAVTPGFKHHVSVGNGDVVVRFTGEIKRGKHVRVTVPVMFPPTSAAAAQ